MSRPEISTKRNVMGALTAQVMNNPEVLAAMQSKLAGMVGLPSGYYDTLPVIVKRRVKALKNLELNKIKIQTQFYKELHDLETKYEVKYKPIFDKRNDIVNGVYEPNEEECNYPSDSEDEEEEEGEKKAEKPVEKEEDKDIKGIPEFWLTILKNVDIFAENIQEHDEPILQHLIDIRVTLIREPESKLAGMVGLPSGYYDTLPVIVKRRVKALKNLELNKIKIQTQFYKELHDLETKYERRVKALKNLELNKIKIQTQFYKELHDLETKYEVKYKPIFDKRNDIVNGVYEPNEEECNYPSDSEDEEEEEGEKKAEKPVEKEEDKDIKGIPEFWLTILKNVDIFAENIQEHDEPILQHLIDIRVTLIREPEGFKLEFVFSPNEFFSNEILTKEYDLRCGPDDEDPFSYDGISIVKCKGCKIEWKKGKNVTEKTVTKKQRHKSKGQVRTVTKTVKNDSFFNFFDPPEVPEKLDDLDDDTHDLLQADWEMGELIK
ncbi:unnamed protein product, partial [Medioppia subpectinata]